MLLTIIKNKHLVLSSAGEKGLVPDRKRLKTCRFSGVKEGMVTWIKCACDNSVRSCEKKQKNLPKG
jgi:hypothetical protein